MNENTGLSVDQIIQIFVALGTILVAIVAIWGEQMKYWLGQTSPKLVLSIADPYGEPINISEEEGHTPAYYFHLRVTNQRRWTPATHVRIVALVWRTYLASGSDFINELSGPLDFVWQYSKYHPENTIVGPDQICNFGFLKKGGNFQLRLNQTPKTVKPYVEPNEKMRIVTKAIADNAESDALVIDVLWDGEWTDNQREMIRHLSVREVKEQDAITNVH